MRKLLAIAFGVLAGFGVWVTLSPDEIDNPLPTTTAPSATNPTVVARLCEPPEEGTRFYPATVEGVTDMVLGLTCADHVTVVSSSDQFGLRNAVAIAEERGGPILFSDGPDLRHAIDTLSPYRVTAVGPAPSALSEAESVAVRQNPPVSSDVDGARGLVLIDLTAPLGVMVAARAYAKTVGAASLTIDMSDLRSLDVSVRSQIATASAPISVISVEPVPDWQLAVVRRNLEIPGGGQLLFPDRRIVALYGSPGFPALGVLGEQDAAGAVDRVTEVAAGYEADGIPVLHGFEIIATVASAGPGEDGDYSYELPPDQIRPWVEEAGRRGVYVILDLQPGRTDFLTQAKRYEELLRLPHVGLALDPEWRLLPTQVHLRQIGTVDASEINTVVDWLAGIVREEALPQKLLLLHQFKLTMITNRELVEVPPELAVVVQMDGQGPLGTKYDTWDALIAAGTNPGWRWGWKNFYDEDSPMATPEQVLAIDPVPVIVTFQ